MGMAFYASKRSTANPAGEWVFTDTELKQGDYVGPEDSETFVPNPSYRPEFNIDMSDANARLVLEALGYAVEGGSWDANPQEFLARIDQWLRRNLDRPSKGIPTRVTGDVMTIERIVAPGTVVTEQVSTNLRRFIDCGIPDGYVNRQVRRLAVFTREAIRRGADLIYAA